MELEKTHTFDVVSKQLATIGGVGLGEVLNNFDDAMEKGTVQGTGTTAPMIHNDFGLVRFDELSGQEAIRRFYALQGSNTRPRVQINMPEHKLHDAVAYLIGVEHIDQAEAVNLIDSGTPTGSLFYKTKVDK